MYIQQLNHNRAMKVYNTLLCDTFMWKCKLGNESKPQNIGTKIKPAKKNSKIRKNEP